MLSHDNEERPFIFRDERTEILDRASFVLNVLTHPKDELSIRYYVAAANGAVVLTELGESEYPLVPGKHLVECSVEEMPDTIMYYLIHPDEWRAISTEMLRHPGAIDSRHTLGRRESIGMSASVTLDRAARRHDGSEVIVLFSESAPGVSTCIANGHNAHSVRKLMMIDPVGRI